MPATRRYKVRLCGIKTQEIAAVERVLGIKAGGTLLDGRLLRDRLTDFNFVCWTLLGSTPATQQYNVRPHAINIHGFTLFCRGGSLW